MCISSPRKFFKNIRTSTVYSHVPGAFLQTVRVLGEQTSLVRVTAEGLVESLLEEKHGGASSLKALDMAQGLVLCREGGRKSWSL